MARITGPGTVPLYVHASKKTPCATSIVLSTAVRVYSRTRPGACGSGGGGVSSESSAFGPPGAGVSIPTIAAWPRAVSWWCWCEAAVAREPSRANGPAATTGGSAQSNDRREIFLAMAKIYLNR